MFHHALVIFTVIINLIFAQLCGGFSIGFFRPNQPPKVSQVILSNETGVQQTISQEVTRALQHLPIKSALAEPIRVVYDTVRPALKFVGMAYLGYQVVSFLMPTIREAIGRSSVPDSHKSRSLSDAVGELGISAVASTLKEWPGAQAKTAAILATWELQCKKRAACELGKSLASRLPYMAKIVSYLGSKLPFMGGYGDALMYGTDLPDCSRAYPDCPYIRSSHYNDEL